LQKTLGAIYPILASVPLQLFACHMALAARLRAETTLTVGWIAERFGMGTRGHLNPYSQKTHAASR
jgi:hypothetical protein